MPEFQMGSRRLTGRGLQCCGRWQMCNQDGPWCAFMAAKRKRREQLDADAQRREEEGIARGEKPMQEGHRVGCTCTWCFIYRERDIATADAHEKEEG